MKTKPPIDLFQTTLKARMRAHTQISDLKSRNSASTQCCIYYNKPKTNHMAQFT